MRSHNPRHYLLYLNLGLFLILLLEIGFYFFIFPEVAVNKIELDSDLALSDETVRQLLGFEKPENYYSIDTDEMEQRARSFALVHEIRITKEFPNRLKVSLQSRKPILVMLQKSALTEETGAAEGLPSGQKNGSNLSQDGEELWQSVPILVDTEGVMFQVGLGSYSDVPVLSGLEFSQGNPLNSRLPSRLHSLVLALGQLNEQRPELYAMISEIRAKMDITNLETDIYLENVPSYIKTSGKVTAHTIETALIAFAVLERSNETTRFLDMRTTGIVYHSVEGQPRPLLKQNAAGQMQPADQVVAGQSERGEL